MHTLTSYNGIAFADIDWEAGFPAETLRGQWDVGSSITSRTGNTSVIGPGPISPRTLIVDFVYVGADDVRDGIDALIGVLNPTDQTPKLLVGTREPAGTDVQRYAKVSMPSTFDAEGNVNVVRAVFTSEDPAWVAVDPVTEYASGSVSPIELAIENEGQAVVHPVYRIGWSANHSAGGTVVGQQYRKRMTLTNTQERTLGPFPWLIVLGDTAALTTAKLQADGDDLQIIFDGASLTRKLIAIDQVRSTAWVVLPGMDALETVTLDVVYGNSAATDPPEWDDPDPDRPIIDLDWEIATATGGTSTTFVKAAAGWETDAWEGAHAYLLSGGNAGEFFYVNSNTSTTLTFTSSASPNHAAGDIILLQKCTNQIWSYRVRQTNHNTLPAGRFYTNKVQTRPNIVSYDSPASWRPELVWDNRDSFGQRRYSWLDNGTDSDAYAILDVARMWGGNDEHVYEPGTADGLSLTTPMPITSLYWQYQLDNPNAMVKCFVGVRESGSEGWSEIFSDNAVTSGYATRGVGGGSVTVLSGIQTNYGNVYQIVMALGPYNDSEIPLTWRRDTGSLTGGTTTTSTDTGAEWETDQYDNGSIRMLSGANSGAKRAISANTATQATHSAFSAANADGDRYEIRNKRLKGQLRDGDKLSVYMDTSAITDSGLGSETAVYDCSMTLWVGEGPNADPDGQHRVLIGWAAGEKRVFITEDEQIEIDTANRRVRIWDAVAEEYTATLTDPAVIVQYHDGTDWRRSANWLPLSTGTNRLWLEEENIGTLELTVTYAPSFLGA